MNIGALTAALTAANIIRTEHKKQKEKQEEEKKNGGD